MTARSPSQGRVPSTNKFRLVDYARTVRTGSRGADGLFVHMAGLGNQSRLCWQTDLAMAAAIGAGERSVTRWLTVLISAGHIKKTHHQKYGRRVRAFQLIGPATSSQSGGAAPPKGRFNASHSGGQNPVKRICKEADLREYARLSNLPTSLELIAALAAIARGEQGQS